MFVRGLIILVKQFDFQQKKNLHLHFFHIQLGASMFRAIEGDLAIKRTQDQNNNMTKIRGDVTNQLWNITFRMNNFNQSSFLKE